MSGIPEFDATEEHPLTPDPNRFDPYDALDSIEREVKELVDHTVGFGIETKKIQDQALALRAYITGMER